MIKMTFVSGWYLDSGLWGKGFIGLVTKELQNLEVIDD